MNDMMTLDPAAVLARLDAAAARFTSPTGAGKMVWRSWGSGKPLVLLHGGSGSWRHWVRNIPYFARTRCVLAPDLPGLGESDLPDRPWTAIRVAEIVARGISQILGPEEKYDIAGFSFGGMISGHVASLPHAPVRSLTLVGSSGLDLPRDPVTLEKVRDKTGAEKMAGHRINLGRLMIHDPARIDDLAVIIQDWNSDHNRFDSRPLARAHTLQAALGKARAKMHSIWGDRDVTAYPYLDAREKLLRSTRPDFDFRLIANAGHWVAYEAADEFNPMLQDMLDSPA